MQVINTLENQNAQSFQIEEGFAYEVMTNIECLSYKFSAGEVLAKQDQLVIGRKNNIQQGLNKFVFYAAKTGFVDVEFSPAEYSNESKLLDVEVRSLGEALKEPVDISKLEIVAAVASISSRVDALKDAVESIYPQVDRLFVYLNGYSGVPSFLNDKKIEVVLDFEGRNAAAAKFYWLSKVNAYYFSIDDDIVYPKDYCQKTIDNYKNNVSGSVVSYHGKNLKLLAGHQRADRKEMFLFENELAENTKAHVLGTGVMMVDTRNIRLPLFEVASHYPRAIDLAVSIYLRKKGIKRYVLNKDSGWLKQNQKVGHGLNEFKQLVRRYSKESCQQVISGRPWVESRFLYYLIGALVIPFKPIQFYVDKNKKLKKLLRDPVRFIVDSKNPIIKKFLNINK